MFLAGSRLAGGVLIAVGVALFAFGGAWAPAALRLTGALPLGDWLELLLPFVPMAVIGPGVLLLVRGPSRRRDR